MSQNHSSSTSPNFQLIFDNALTAYKKHTKRDLLKHPLAIRLEACDSPSSILIVLHEQVQERNESRCSNERLTKWLGRTVKVLHAFSETLGAGVSLVFPPAKVIFTGFGVLLSAAKDAGADQDPLIEMLKNIEGFLRRLETYIAFAPNPEMMVTITAILVEVLNVLAISTKEIQQGRMKKYLKKLMGKTDIEDALKKLDRLTQEEARMASTQLMKVTNTIDNGVSEVADNVLAINNRVAGVDIRVAGVDDKLASVGDQMKDAVDRVKADDDKMMAVNDGVEYMLEYD